MLTMTNPIINIAAIVTLCVSLAHANTGQRDVRDASSWAMWVADQSGQSRPRVTVPPAVDPPDINECLTTKPCQNGGICQNTPGSYLCICDGTGYAGKTCSIDINECLTTKHCQNGGTCQNTVGSYVCSCDGTGYTGNTCSKKDDGFTQLGSKFYKVFNNRVKYHNQAAAICAQHQARLPEPKTEVENRNLASLNSKTFFLGMTDEAQEDRWVWDSDSSDVTWFTWMDWTPEPGWGGINPNGGTSENCVIMLKDHGEAGRGHRPEAWADKPCGPFAVDVVCERD